MGENLRKNEDEERRKRIEKARQRRAKRQTHSLNKEIVAEKEDVSAMELEIEEATGNKISKVIGIVLCAIQFITSCIFIGAVMKLNMLPDKYVAAGGVVLFVLFGVILAGQILSKKHGIIGKILSVILTGVLIVASLFVFKASSTVTEMTGAEVKLDSMVVAVLVDDEAEDILDATDYTFGVQGTEEVEGLEGHAATMVEEIESQVGTSIKTIEYTNLSDQITALQNNEVQAIIYNEAYLEIIEDEEPGITDTLKVIYEYGIEVAVEVTVAAEPVLVSQEPFSVYISGIDVYGSITTNSRSDVNIIATVNPETHQVLLVTTPRDYYVILPGVTGSSKDKLTHAGIYGVDVSMATLEAVYDIELDFYARVNFTSLINMVDALGGISVYSSESFTTTAHEGIVVDVVEGYNYFTGTEALMFARERYNVSGGDFQRGENQLEVIKGMIEKVTSPSIITSAYDLLDSVSGSLDTNMSTDQIQTLIKNQLTDGAEWTIITMSAEGTTGSEMCYSYSGGELSIVYPNYDSVAEISEAIQAVLDGEILE